MPASDTRFMKACRKDTVDTTPVWLMRQAGRIIPEFRKVREEHSLVAIWTHPELCAEVTLQPLRHLDVDAVLLFSDLLLPLVGVGVAVETAEGIGPVIAEPLRGKSELDVLRPLVAEQDVPYVLEAVRLVARELNGKLPLITFCGTPFTLAAYLIEGIPSNEFARTKRLMYGEPDMWHTLMERLASIIVTYAQAQSRAGADVLQLFDSWVGCLSPQDYEQYVEPYTRRIIEALRSEDLPIIHYGANTSTLLGQLKDDGAGIIGVDWRIPLDVAWDTIGSDLCIQGNLDPATLLAPSSVMEAQAADVLLRASGRPGHIFNLGHGLFHTTPLENVVRLVDFVHAFAPQVSRTDLEAADMLE